MRLDYYGLTPNPDADFWRSSGAVNLLPTASNYWSASPKLGLLYRFTDDYSGFFQYARGFRAPPYDNANFAFNNATSFYQILPNANLKPETATASRSASAASTGTARAGSSRASTTSTTTSSTRWWSACSARSPSSSTSTSATSRSGASRRAASFASGPNGRVLGYFAFAQGYDTQTGLPVDSVDPVEASARLRYGYQQGFGAQLIGTLVGAHNQVSNPTYFQAPGYFTLDATVGYNFNDHVKINAGAFNITNAKYWNSQDVIGVAATNHAARPLRPARPLLRRQPHDEMVVPAALSAERLPAPSARAPRVSMALSLALHGLAVVPLLLAGTSGSTPVDEPAFLVEVSLAAPAPSDATGPADPQPSESSVDLPMPDQPRPVATDVTRLAEDRRDQVDVPCRSAATVEHSPNRRPIESTADARNRRRRADPEAASRHRSSRSNKPRAANLRPQAANRPAPAKRRAVRHRSPP